jgi:protein CpxP
MDIFRKQKIVSRTIIILILLNIFLISFLFWKQMKPNREPLLFPKNETYKDLSIILKKELNLNEKQVSNLDEIRERYYLEEIDLKRKIKNYKDEMNKEMFNKNTDENKIIRLAKQISSFEYQMEMIRYCQAKELKSVCTPEQQEKFETLVKEIRDYFRPDNQPNKR